MKSQLRRPRAQSLLLVVSALRSFIPSVQPVCAFRKSASGRMNLRYQANTNGLPWTVDLYQGHYYRAHVGTGIGEVLRSVPALIGYLKRTLGVVDVSD